MLQEYKSTFMELSGLEINSEVHQKVECEMAPKLKVQLKTLLKLRQGVERSIVNFI